MGFYQDQIIPLLINWSMRQRNLTAYRSRIIPAAEGRVLEIGIGSGLNLPFYSRNVTHVIGLEPAPKLMAMARRVERTGCESVEFIEGSAEAIPVKDASVDTVVTTWTLCSIPDALRALRTCAGCFGLGDISCSSNTGARLIRRLCGGRIG
jgi:ubiquinone/menaquinone biosynthesis C-methylase UbiE